MRVLPIVLATVVVAVLFAGLGTVDWMDVREARDARVASELIAARDPLTPLYGHEPLFEKPVLGYVPEVLVRWSGGGVERSRTVRAGVAVALLLVTAAAGARHFGARAGALGAGVLATTVLLPLAARTDGTQLLATLFGWVGVAGLADVTFGRASGRDLRLVVTWGALAATLLVAGPLAALWPVAALGLYAWLSRDGDAWRRARPAAGLVLMLGAALPWYGAMLELYGGAFAGRVAVFPYATGTAGPWYAGAVLALAFVMVGFFPWSALLPGALTHAATWWRLSRFRAREAAPPERAIARDLQEERAAHFLILCIAVGAAPVAFYPGPPLPAALPALPAAALLCGRLLDHLLDTPPRVARLIGDASRMLVLAGTGLAVALMLLGRRMGDEVAPALQLLAAALLVTSWAPFLAAFIGRHRAAALLMALPVAAGTPIVSLRVLPAMEHWLGAQAVARAFEAAAPPRTVLLLPDPPPPSLRLASSHAFVPARDVQGALREWRSADGHAYLAFRPARESAVARAAAAPLEILLRTPALVLARVAPGR